MKTQATFEVGIVAANLDALLAFYTGVLDLSVVGDVQVPPRTSRKAGLAADGYRVVRLETDRGDRIKLAAPAGGPGDQRREAFAMQRAGLCYLTFLVADLDALAARLEGAGATVLSERIVELRQGVRMLLAADPEGNSLEFVQYDDIDAYREPAR
jgi:predicted enzyme related to lactoylglutathione lyase